MMLLMYFSAVNLEVWMKSAEPYLCHDFSCHIGDGTWPEVCLLQFSCYYAIYFR